jgi:hypothetical protein
MASNLRQVSYMNVVVATRSVSFTYDTNYNRRMSMVDGVGTNQHSYHAYTNGLGAGRLLSLSTVSIQAATYSTGTRGGNGSVKTYIWLQHRDFLIICKCCRTAATGR